MCYNTRLVLLRSQNSVLEQRLWHPDDYYEKVGFSLAFDPDCRPISDC